LVPALERLRDTFAEQTGMRVDFESQIRDRLPPGKPRSTASCRRR
jgi:hypothetical protein